MLESELWSVARRILPYACGEALADDAMESLMQDSEQVLPVCVLGLRRFWRQNLPGAGMVRH